MIKLIRDWIAALIFSIIFALIFRTWFYAPYRVPTGSMVQTIQVGDHVFVNKHAYGFHIPFLEDPLAQKSVQREDVVVFTYPTTIRVDYIKRVIGIPGDTIQIVGETVYINGEPERMDYLYYDPDLLPLPEDIEVVVPKGKLWVMGDNRRDSKDSRYWGFVDIENVLGKAEIIFWSHNPKMPLTKGHRYDRIGIRLH